MKKKKLKLLALPLAIASASVIGMVSGTLAYFTSMDKATVSIEAGQVKIDMALSNLSLYSLDVEQTEAGTEGGKSVTYFENHGFALLENNVLTLSKITPGDKVSFKATITNNSNVDAKYALIIDYANEHTGLENGYVPHAGDHVTATKKLSEGLVTTGLTSGTALINIDVGGTVERAVTIELPKEAGDQYQDASGEIVIKAVALQRNAPMTAELYLELANAHTRSEAYPGASIAKLNTVGMDILNEPCLEGLDLVWNGKTSDFRIETYSSLNSVDDWAFVSSLAAMSSSNKYSSYLLGNSLDGTITSAAGVDVGENAGISQINYVHTVSPAQSVVINTNNVETTLSINGYVDATDSSVGDVIHHYGEAGSLEIIKCANGSYHEFGNIAFAEISTGRMVLENDSEIKHIHINANATSDGFNEVSIADKGATALPSAITRSEVTVADQTLVVTVESVEGDVEEVYVYPNGDIGTTEKTTTQNAHVETDLGELVLDNGSEAGEKALDEDSKEAKKEEVVEEAVAEDSQGYEARIGNTKYETFSQALAYAKAQDDTSTIYLLADITNQHCILNTGKNITINVNLNGHKFSADNDYASSPSLFVAFANETLNVYGGTVSFTRSATGRYIFDAIGGTVNLDDLHVIDRTPDRVALTRSNGTMVINNSSFDIEGKGRKFQNGGDGSACTMTIEDVSFEMRYNATIYYAPVENTKGTMSLIDSEFLFSKKEGASGNLSAPSVTNKETMTIDNTRIVSDGYDHTLANASGATKMTIKGNSTYITALGDKKNAVDNFATLEVEGGTLVAGPNSSTGIGNAAISHHTNSVSTIKGGTFLVRGADENPHGQSDCLTLDTGTWVIEGGNYNQNICAEGYYDPEKVTFNGSLTDNGDGTWTFVKANA